MRSFYRKAIEKIKEDPSYEIMEIKHFEDGLKVVSDNLKAYYKKYMIDDNGSVEQKLSAYRSSKVRIFRSKAKGCQFKSNLIELR